MWEMRRERLQIPLGPLWRWRTVGGGGGREGGGGWWVLVLHICSITASNNRSNSDSNYSTTATTVAINKKKINNCSNSDSKEKNKYRPGRARWRRPVWCWTGCTGRARSRTAARGRSPGSWWSAKRKRRRRKEESARKRGRLDPWGKSGNFPTNRIVRETHRWQSTELRATL